VLVQDASPCIRLPYAEADAYTEDYAAQLGMEIIWWDVDPFDWSSPGQENIENTVISEASPNDIILLHDGGGNRAQTVAALETILEELSREGYIFEALCSD
jgi:peptidoglycan/xylan/chitin deacetylase (PgdA/CDA1 family)